MKFFYLVLLLFFLASFSYSSGPKIWEVFTNKDFEKGKFVNTILTPKGEVSIGNYLDKFDQLKTTIWCVSKDKSGNFFIGTNNNGTIYKINKKSEKVYKTKELIVTSIVINKGDLYAGTIPNGKIFCIKNGKGKLLVQLPSLYIWQIKYFNNKLYAATGPKGIVYEINPINGKYTVLAQTTQEHLLSMDIDTKGNIYLGSSPDGILYKILPNRKILVIADLPENEIRSLAVYKEQLFIGANEIKNLNKAKGIKLLARKISQQSEGKRIDRGELVKKSMNCAVYKYSIEDGFEKLLELKKNFITKIKNNNNDIFCSTGFNGRIYKVNPKAKYSIECDINEEQIMDFCIKNGKVDFFVTGDNGFIYKSQASKLTDSYYYSKIYDANAFSKWGTLYLNATGKLLIETRSGNTKKADKFWSDWDTVNNKQVIKSPNARYLQFRGNWQGNGAVIKSVKIIYQPNNHSPEITEFKMDIPDDSTRKIYRDKPKKEIKFKWKCKDQDKDNLRYELYYKNLEVDHWYKIIEEKKYDKKDYKWDTQNIPDGFYIIKFVATDDLENFNSKQAIHKTRPIVIDNHPPVIMLKKEQHKITGEVQDNLSIISQISYRLDNKKWIILKTVDGIYDTIKEKFVLNIKLNKKSILEIKALDEAGNISHRFVK